MDFQELRPGIFTATLDPAQVNVTLIVGGERALLVDTGSSQAQGEEIRAAVERATDKPLSYVVASHAHWDHAWGLGAFTDVETIAHESFAEDSGCAENRERAAEVGAAPTVSTPKTLLSLIGVRDLGGLTVEIAHFGVAHTHGDLIVAVPDSRVLVVGDLVEDPPSFDETSSLDGWVRCLDAVYALLRDDTLVVPGHGHAMGPWEVGHVRSGLAAIWGQAEWAYNKGVPVEDLYTYDNLEWPWDQASAEAGIRVAYRELGERAAR
ncbi:MAG: MBL fold metallo-hydrolase [Propionibacteriaceae bacterium]|jgi:glyoxylase-like metal-dependent hydrolase (beta-lactamase superfamily II)|nr:MBL fold metallo-hydrolase [Propionibacteriaceae bacterium]